MHPHHSTFMLYVSQMVEPFYIGKGKNNRAWGHLKEYISNKPSNRRKFKNIEQCIDPPIIFIIDGNLDEKSAYAQEKILVERYGRQSLGGQLSNIMPGGIEFSSIRLSSIGGQIGGRTTKDNNLGIFADDYDRGAQTRFNFEHGLMDHIDFHSIGKIAGAASVVAQKGIHDPENFHKRTMWAKMGAKASLKNGPHGPANKEWRDSHPEYIPAGSSINAKRTGNLPWWNNGVINRRSEEPPGKDFVSGQLQSEKKLQAIRDEHIRRKLKLIASKENV